MHGNTYILQVADLLAFVASPNSLHEADDTESFIDSFGSQCLSVFRTLGLPSTSVLIRVCNISHTSSVCLSVLPLLSFQSLEQILWFSLQDLPEDLKRRHEVKKVCMSVLAPEFPEDCKFYPADKKDELHKVWNPEIKIITNWSHLWFPEFYEFEFFLCYSLCGFSKS